MSNIRAQNDWVILEKFNKVTKSDPDSPFTTALAVSNTNLGVVLYSNDSDIVEGTKVYYVGSVEKLMLEDAREVLAVKSENIVASIGG